MCAAIALFVLPQALIKPEIHINNHTHGHWMSLIHRRLELILPDRFDGLLIQTHTQMPHYLNILRIAVGIDDQLYRDRARILLPARLICKFGIDCMNDLRRSHASTNAHNAAAKSTTATWPNAITMSGTEPTT